MKNQKANEFFGKVKALVQEEDLFTTWFSDTNIFEDGLKPTLNVPHSFTKNWIKRKYLKELNAISEEIWNKELEIVCNSSPSIKQTKNSGFLESKVSKSKTNLSIENLKSKTKPLKFNNLDQFISGTENQLLKLASQQFIEQGQYSPLILQGDHGLGKSLLAQCISQHFEPSKRIFYRTEEFTNAFIAASRKSELDDFRKNIRKKDLFILEDLDFLLEGKRQKTVQELLNTFKAMQKNNRRIVVTMRAPLSEFQKLHHGFYEALTTGLRLTINPPSQDSIGQMVEQTLKADPEFKMSTKVTQLVKEIPFNSLGETQKALLQIKAYSAIEKDRLPLKVAKDILAEFLRRVGGPKKDEKFNQYCIALDLVCSQFGLTRNNLLSESRQQLICLARHTLMALIQEVHFGTLREIARFFGGMQHQSVLYGIQKIKRKRREEPDFALQYSKLKESLSQHQA